MQYGPYGGGTVNYEPNTLADGMPHEAPVTCESHEHLDADIGRKKISIANDFKQAGERYRSLSKMDKDHLVGNIVDSLGHADKSIQKRMLQNLGEAYQELGRRVAEGLKL
jgi:catalase